jgi:hypothetical protein
MLLPVVFEVGVSSSEGASAIANFADIGPLASAIMSVTLPTGWPANSLYAAMSSE